MGQQADENYRQWQQAFREYRLQLATLRDRLNEETLSFFEEPDVHDGELLELRLIDGSRPAPLSEPGRPWNTITSYPVRAELAVLDAMDQFVWHVSYSILRRVVIDYPSEEAPFYQAGEGFGDWGYHELTDAGDGFLRHEVLFRSGATLAFEFRNITVKRMHARGGAAPRR